MDISKKPVLGPGEEWFDGIIKLVAVWGTAWMIGESTFRLFNNVLPRGWRDAIAVIGVGLFLAAMFSIGKRQERLRETFLGWRYPIALLLAAYVGYQWHAHDYARSQEARLNEAARWACARVQSCQKMTLDYLADKEFD